MTERRMTQIMRERDGFDQVFIQTQIARYCASDLRDFQRMGQPRPKQIAFMIDENLRFVFQPAKSRRMNDAIAIALELTAGHRIGFTVATATRPNGVRCKGG
jgi:hypothetical protein